MHFLTSDKDADVVGKSNDYEKEEYSRAVCVQKYYPEKFWDYLICRSKQIKSAYWEDCLCGVDSLRVKTCARGPEGVTLLSENTRLNQQLRISSGPSYLLNNQEIFASQGVPSQEELAKILKN